MINGISTPSSQFHCEGDSSSSSRYAASNFRQTYAYGKPSCWDKPRTQPGAGRKNATTSASAAARDCAAAAASSPAVSLSPAAAVAAAPACARADRCSRSNRDSRRRSHTVRGTRRAQTRDVARPVEVSRHGGGTAAAAPAVAARPTARAPSSSLVRAQTCAL